MSRKRWFLIASLGVALALVACSSGNPLTATLTSTFGTTPARAQDKGLELTVYNSNLALVKDRRAMTLTTGLNSVRFSDVASAIDATSVHFRSLTDPTGTSVLEQNYEYDIVGSAKLLQKYLDQEITLVTEDGSAYTGTLLSGADDIILQGSDGKVTVIKLGQVREFRFPALPEGLITKPTLVWMLQAAKAGKHDVEVTYLTSGVNWKADYVLVLAEDDASLALNGWVTVDNNSGAAYKDARLKLVAGDVNRVQGAEEVKYYDGARAPAPTAVPQVVEREFFEYHLYEIQRPVTLKEQQTKQIEFVTAPEIKAEKFFVYNGMQGWWSGYYGPITEPQYGPTSNTKVMTMLEFKNSKDDGLGVPLPKGTVRVYKEDTAGGTEFVGEDAIDHTPRDEKVRLYLGDAFDIVGERRQTDFVKLGDRALEESFEISIRNHKKTAVEVRVVEYLFRWSEWQITAKSHDYTKMDSSSIEFRVNVPADGEVKVTYTVRYRW
jgi:hypothetical protein